MQEKRKTAFLDRDGTIIEDVDRLTNEKEIKLIDGATEAIKLLNDENYLTIIITNQSVIGRGLINNAQLERIHNKLRQILQKKGAFIDEIYYCPHVPEDQCNCRKPKTGLIKHAIKEFNVDLENSFMIGDNLKDLELAKNVNIPGFLVRTGYGSQIEALIDNSKIGVYDTILEAIKQNVFLDKGN